MIKLFFILIVGFYCLGINGDFDFIVCNFVCFEEVFGLFFCFGYVLMIGEWVVLLILCIFDFLYVDDGDVMYEMVY